MTYWTSPAIFHSERTKQTWNQNNVPPPTDQKRKHAYRAYIWRWNSSLLDENAEESGKFESLLPVGLSVCPK
jgi:hypothetical protein